MVSIPQTEPEVFIAGDTVEFQISLPDYPPSAGWVLSYTWTNAAGVFNGLGVDDGAGNFLVTLDAADTLAYAPGRYGYQGRVFLAGVRKTVREGWTTVQLSAEDAAPQDVRTIDEKLLDAVESALLGRMNTDQASYSVGGVSISRLSPAELLTARDQLIAKVQRLRDAEAVRKGRGVSTTISVVL